MSGERKHIQTKLSRFLFNRESDDKRRAERDFVKMDEDSSSSSSVTEVRQTSEVILIDSEDSKSSVIYISQQKSTDEESALESSSEKLQKNVDKMELKDQFAGNSCALEKTEDVNRTQKGPLVGSKDDPLPHQVPETCEEDSEEEMAGGEIQGEKEVVCDRSPKPKQIQEKLGIFCFNRRFEKLHSDDKLKAEKAIVKIDHSSKGSISETMPSEVIVLSSTSSSDESNSVMSTSKSETSNDDESMKSFESSLEKLQKIYPTADKMELQDLLTRNSCDLKKTEGELNLKRTPKRQLEDPEDNIPAHKVQKTSEDASEEEDDAEEDGIVYQSDEDDDDDVSVPSDAKQEVLDFLSKATVAELLSVPSCHQKKAEVIVENRPYSGWKHLVETCKKSKLLGTNILNTTQKYLKNRMDVFELMLKCLKLSEELENKILSGTDCIKEQPSLLSKKLSLNGYQMAGLNWLYTLYKQKVSGILADEMGLGKTAQVIAFLAYLKEISDSEDPPLHLIVVPASVLENWKKELESWCPSLKVAMYHGHPNVRRAIRIKWIKSGPGDADVILTTYNILNGTNEDKKIFRILSLDYVVLDEAHMVKNMCSQRYGNMSRINASHRILLTGTPIQNNLMELMSLLTFLMPDFFKDKMSDIKALFTKYPKAISQQTNEGKLSGCQQEQVGLARRIMKPFLLRRLKSDVKKDIPPKTVTLLHCELTEEQKARYEELRAEFYSLGAGNSSEYNPMSALMTLRKVANHPLLDKTYYTDELIQEIAGKLSKIPAYKKNDSDVIYDDLNRMSDFEVHQLTQTYEALSDYAVPAHLFLESGKLKKLDGLLPDLKSNNHRVVIFSQFINMLDILEEYLKQRGHTYLRFDGSTPVKSRQQLIDSFNEDDSIFAFLVSTRAGGMGINLTSADTVILHDMDFNPYNDKQAEDRCHRVGQTREVTVFKMLSLETVDENIFNVGQNKLFLGEEITSTEESDAEVSMAMRAILEQVLGLKAGQTGFPLIPEKE